jgi:3-dehydroquinate synthase
MTVAQEPPAGLFDGYEAERVKRRFVVLDANVERNFGKQVNGLLEQGGAPFEVFVVEAAEMRKDVETMLAIAAGAQEFGVGRHDELWAVGGGVIQDVTGLAAAMIRKRIPYVSIPTTLIAMVDAGPAHKRAVNFNGAKNYLGSYWAPRLTLCDPEFLETLDDRQIRAGMAEIWKVGLMVDGEVIELLDEHGPDLVRERFNGDAPAGRVLSLAIGAHVRGTGDDPAESYLRRWLDSNHLVGHALEMATNGLVNHGEGVAICGALTTVLAEQRGLISPALCTRLISVPQALNLPTFHELLLDEPFMAEVLDAVTDHRGAQHIPVPSEVGGWRYVEDATAAELVSVAGVLRQRFGGAA